MLIWYSVTFFVLQNERDQSGCEASEQKRVALENANGEEAVALQLEEELPDSLIDLEELAALQKV